jgi:hypothetical protein
MSDIQSGMVFASLINPELAMYHDQFVFRLSEKIDLDVFEKSLGLEKPSASAIRETALLLYISISLPAIRRSRK